MGHPGQPQSLAQLPPLGRERHHAVVVGLEELSQREHGEELWLRVIAP